MKGNLEWSQATTHAAKSAFRQKWVAMQWKAETTKRTKSTMHEKSTDEQGTYLPLDMIIKNEGGARNIENVVAARRYATRCLAQGKKWVKFNDWTGRLEFLYIRHNMNKVWSDRWDVTKTEVAPGGRAAQQGHDEDDRDGHEEAEPASPGLPKAKAKAKAKASTEPKGKAQPKAKGSAGKTVLQMAVQKGSKLRTEYHGTVSNSQQLLEQVANTTKLHIFVAMSATLSKSITELKSSLSDFATDFLVMETRDIKDKYSEAVSTVELHAMLKDVPPLLAAVEAERKKLLNHVKVEGAHDQKPEETPTKKARK